MSTPMPGPVETAAVIAMATEILDAMCERDDDRTKELLDLLVKRFEAPGLLICMSEWVRQAEARAGSDLVLARATALLGDFQAVPPDDRADTVILWVVRWVQARVLDDIDGMLALVRQIQEIDPGPQIWVLVSFCADLIGRITPADADA